MPLKFLFIRKRSLQRLLLSFLAVLNFFADAGKPSVILKAPGTASAEFKAYVETEEVESYARVLLKEIKSSKNDERVLRSLLSSAQESFLKGHLRTSGDYFNSITKKAYEKDWTDKAREIIFYSFLRLAQIEWKGRNPEVFLHSAFLFASDLQPDASLFPPPLVQKFNMMKKNSPSTPVLLNHIFPFHELILINGKVFNLYDDLKLPYGKYRVTALSSSHELWNRVISLAELSQKRIVTAPLVRGTCQNPIVSKKFKTYQILFSDFCLWAQSVNGVKTLKESPAGLKSISTKENSGGSHHLNSGREPLKISPASKWTALALSAVVLGAVYYLSHEGKDEKETKKQPSKPTIKIGF